MMMAHGLERQGGNVLYTLLCLLILAVLFAGAYYAAQYVVGLQHKNIQQSATIKEMNEDIESANGYIRELQQAVDGMKYQNSLNGQTTEEQNGWDTFNPRG
ncbi:hypothetical protein D3C73_362260 [compost metagenome]